MASRMTQLLMVAALMSALPAQAQVASRPRPALTEMSASIETTVRQVEPAVVEIFTTSYAPADGVVPRTADLVTTQRASGWGVIVDPEGCGVTSADVVRGANRVRVELVTPAAGASILASRSRTVAAEV